MAITKASRAVGRRTMRYPGTQGGAKIEYPQISAMFENHGIRLEVTVGLSQQQIFNFLDALGSQATNRFQLLARSVDVIVVAPHVEGEVVMAKNDVGEVGIVISCNMLNKDPGALQDLIVKELMSAT